MSVPRVAMFKPYVSDLSVELVVASLRSGWIGQGPKVIELEKSFAKHFGLERCVAVNGVFSAVRLALTIAGVKPGDEVITSAQVCTQINHPILELGATPVFADVNKLSGNIEPSDIERRITAKTKAIIATHYGGLPCDLQAIRSIADRNKLTLIEDASDAVGAQYNGKKIGLFGDFACFSLAAVQQITSIEGGILVCKNEDQYQAAVRRRWFAIDKQARKPNIQGYYDYDVKEVGFGYHLSDINAAVAIGNLADFESNFLRRTKIAAYYNSSFKNVSGLQLPKIPVDTVHAYQLYLMQVERRDEFCKKIREAGIDVSIVHERNDLNSVFGGRRTDLLGLDSFERSNICIPLYPAMSDEEVERVVCAIVSGW